jgi:hypothetical protein
MSNRATIIQQTTTIKYNGQESKEIVVADDYAMGTIDLDSSDTFYEDDLELLAMVVQSIAEGGFDAITGVLDHVQECERGMNIEGTWYDWEEIKHVLGKS